MYTCPVCFFDQLTEPARDYNICDCCGTEFGNDDEIRTHEELRRAWVDAGTPWFFGDPPAGWNTMLRVISSVKPSITYFTADTATMVFIGGKVETYAVIDKTNTINDPTVPPCGVPVYGLAA